MEAHWHGKTLFVTVEKSRMGKWLKLPALLILLSSGVSCTLPEERETKQPGPTNTSAVPAGYIIQQGDILEISVWKDEALQKELLVRPDGGLTFPLAGEIAAAGKTTKQLQRTMTTRLAKYIPKPVVTVTVKKTLGNKIYVLGKVNRPGVFTIHRNIDVMQALSLAGGLTPFAAGSKIQILRRDSGSVTAIPFEYTMVEQGTQLEQDILLQSGDVVVVP